MSKKKAETTRSAAYPLLAIVGVLAAAVFAFSPALNNSFVNWDDYAYIVNNPLVHNLSIANTIEIFTPTTFVVGNYHPLTVFVYSIEYALFGLDPTGYHALNIILHLANIILVSLIAWRMFKHQLAAVFITAVFALHPLRVESVVWAAELKDVLYVGFFLAACLAYIRNVQNGDTSLKAHAVVYGLFLLSILSKGQAVVFPVILLILDYMLEKKFDKQTLLSKIPYFATSVAFGFLAIAAQRGGQLSAQGGQIVLPLFERLGSAAYGVLMYIVSFVAPVNLACFYEYPLPEKMGSIMIIGALSAAAFVGALYAVRSHRNLLGGLLWFLVVIGPVSQVLPVGNALYADRYSYLSMVGILLALGYGIKHWLSHQQRAVQVATVAVALVFAVLSRGQSKTWFNNESLWTAALEANPNNALVLNNLAGDYLDSGKTEVAIDLFKRAVDNPGRYTEIYRTYNNIGLALSRLNKLDSSLYWYGRAIETGLDFPDPHYNRAGVYQSMGNLPRAYQDISQFIALTPKDNRGYFLRGKILRSMDSITAAVRDFRASIQLNPASPEGYVSLGNLYFSRGEFQNCVDVYTEALRNIPQYGDIYLNRSKAWFMLNNLPSALTDYQNAVNYGAQEPGFLAAIQQRMAAAKITGTSQGVQLR